MAAVRSRNDRIPGQRRGQQTNYQDSLNDLLREIADRSRPRSEATLQSDIRRLLLLGDFGLTEDHIEVDLETHAGHGRRIDIELGYTVIEVKKNLEVARTVRDAEKQLEGYVAARSSQTNQRYVGILTDGLRWHAYRLNDTGLTRVTTHIINPARPNGLNFFYWLEGVLATRQGIKPEPAEIAQRLGASSTSHALDRALLAELYENNASEPAVAIKRQVWAQLLKSALGTQFVDDSALFVEHTLLMNSADIIAHLVLGLDVMSLPPASLISGQRFERARILGVVEQDFFDWTLEVAGGADFIRSLARRLARFDWSDVEHDVLKVLYESVIGKETRKRMGEYYTPNWLAEKIIDVSVTDPLRQRVLDPACGSGTFLFHAVKRYLGAADAIGQSTDESLRALSRHVIGVDLHPLAVAFARVTYLLAIGRDRLTGGRRGPVSVPVYLGDSIQWREQLDLFTDNHLRIRAGHEASLWEEFLRFPEHLLSDAGQFDRLVSAMANLAAKPRDRDTVPSLNSLFRTMPVMPRDQPVIRETFSAMCRLHDEGRNHIWSYYIRNLARPVWLAMSDNRVDVLVGNPPWLSYRHMPKDMQAVFKELAGARGLWQGNNVATQQDLSALFVARAVQQYLKSGGSFAFVLPNAALDREYFVGFRSGLYADRAEPTAVYFNGSWDLRRLRPHLFLRGASVVFGTRTTVGRQRRLPSLTEQWTGKLPESDGSWEYIGQHVARRNTELAGNDHSSTSPYKSRFANGATVFPRLLFFVDLESHDPLGLAAGDCNVRSARSSNEKPPWKDLESLDGVVEAEFVRRVLLGESVLPYRVLNARDAVLPLLGSELLTSDNPRLDHYPGLADWWTRAESTWMANRSSNRLSLSEQLDFRRKLTAQLPAPSLRIVYGKAGMHVAAAIVDDSTAIIDHKLYWAALASEDEGYFLCAILNSPALTDLVRPLMSYGKDERDVDKHIWKLPIPIFDVSVAAHRHLVELGREQADLVARLSLDEDINFVANRRHVRVELITHRSSSRIDKIVKTLLE